MKTTVSAGKRGTGAQPFVPVRPRASLLQGACACGSPAAASDECESCRAGKLQPARQRGAAAPQTIPAIVHQVLRSPGQPLDTAIGAECDRVWVLDSARLLTHEQYHFRLACTLAKKASAAVAAKPQLTPGRARDLASAPAARLSAQYDSETSHGCIVAAQARWQTNIDNGLPSARIP
jgi:hypothetical protein